MKTTQELQEQKNQAKKDYETRLAEIEAEEKNIDAGWWEPSDGERFSYILDGCIVGNWHINTKTIARLVMSGNCYRTEKEAIKALRKQRSIQKIRKYIALNMPFVPDLKNSDQKKYYITYSYTMTDFVIWWEYAEHPQPDNLYFKSKDDAAKLIKDMEPELLTYFGVER